MRLRGTCACADLILRGIGCWICSSFQVFQEVGTSVEILLKSGLHAVGKLDDPLQSMMARVLHLDLHLTFVTQSFAQLVLERFAQAAMRRDTWSANERVLSFQAAHNLG